MDLGDNVKQKINSETPSILSLYERRDYNQALALLDQQITKNNDDLDAIIRKTYLLFERGFIQAAIAFIKDKIKTSSRASILCTILGLIYFFIGNEEDSIECLKSSQKKSSKHETTIALLRKACLNYQQAKNDNENEDDDNSEVLKDSLQDISNGLAIPNIYISHTLAFLLKGKIYHKEQNFVEAIECYKGILSIDKKNIYCMYLQAKCHLDQNDFTLAKLLLSKVLEIYPDHKLSLELQASIFFTEKNFSNLETALNILLAKHADSHEGLYYNSHIHFFKADYKIALIQIEKCLQLKSDYSAGLKLKAKILILMNKSEDAKKFINSSLKKLPNNSKICLARIHFNQSSYKEYLNLNIKSQISEELKYEILYIKGYSSLFIKDYDGALKYFSDAITESPTNIYANLGIYLISYQTKDFIRADLYYKIFKIKFDNLGIYDIHMKLELLQFLAKSYMLMKDYPLAYIAYNDMRKLKSDFEPGYIIHALCKKNDYEILNQMLPNVNDFYEINTEMQTPLIVASVEGHLETSQVLVKKNAFISQHHNFAETAIEIAYKNDNKSLFYYLISQRQSFSLPQLNAMIINIKEKYRGIYDSRKEDCELLDNYVRSLTTEDISGIRKKDRDKHYLQNESKAGFLANRLKIKKEEGNETTITMLNGVKVTGWDLNNFLTLRIRCILEIIIKIELGIIKDNELPKIEKISAINKIKYELLTNIETLRARKDSILVYEDYEETESEQGINAHINNICHKIAALDNGQEYCYFSGYPTHAIYVSFYRNANKIIIRIDNLGYGISSYHKCDMKEDKFNIESKYVSPYFYKEYEIEKFLNLDDEVVKYIRNLFFAKNQKCESDDDKKAALEKIYGTQAYGANVSRPVYPIVHWTAKKAQATGICMVKCHQVGQQYRLFLNNENNLSSNTNKTGKRLYRWLNNEINKVNNDKAPEHDFELDLDKLPTDVNKMRIVDSDVQEGNDHALIRR